MHTRTALLALAVCAPFTTARASEVVLTRSVHTDAYKTPMGEAPAKDFTQTIWLGKDRLRLEEPGKVTIVRLDQKMMYLVDDEAKTVSTIELPVDMGKLLPPAQAKQLEAMTANIKTTVTPTEDKKKVRDWNCTRYVVEVSSPVNMHADLWTTQDTKVDTAAYYDLMTSVLSMTPGSSSMLTEMRKIQGLPVVQERTQKLMGVDVHGREELMSIESRDTLVDVYTPPKDYKTKPFDLAEEAAKARAAHGKPMPKGDKPAEKPAEKPAPHGG